MYSRFEKAIREKGVTPYKLAKDVGISNVTLTQWKHGRYTPKFDKLKKIADYLEMDVMELLDE